MRIFNQLFYHYRFIWQSIGFHLLVDRPPHVCAACECILSCTRARISRPHHFHSAARISREHKHTRPINFQCVQTFGALARDAFVCDEYITFFQYLLYFSHSFRPLHLFAENSSCIKIRLLIAFFTVFFPPFEFDRLLWKFNLFLFSFLSFSISIGWSWRTDLNEKKIFGASDCFVHFCKMICIT